MKLIPDTNLWSYLADEHAAYKFASAARKQGFAILIPPSMLLEILRNPNRAVRKRHVKAMLSAHATHLAPEAESEALELIDEAKRCRPSWVRAVPDLATERKWHLYWTEEVWRYARNDLDALASAVRRDSRDLDTAASVRKENTAGYRAEFGTLALPLNKWTAEVQPGMSRFLRGGWPPGATVEGWRAETISAYWYALAILPERIGSYADNTTADWLGARLDLRAMVEHPKDFCEFFFRDIEARNVPRIWLRWAVGMAGRRRKAKYSDPVDQQHATYLVDCDIFVTADKAFADAVDEVRTQAPFSMCSVSLVNHIEGRTLEALARTIDGLVG